MRAEPSRLSLEPGRLSGALAPVAWIPAPFGGAQAAGLFLRNTFMWVNPYSLSPHSQVPGWFLTHSQVNKGVWCDLKVWRIFGVCYLSLVITDVQVGSYATRPKKRGTGAHSYG